MNPQPRNRATEAGPAAHSQHVLRGYEQTAGTLNEETWGFSSAGRASALQAEGQGFKSPKLHLRLLSATGENWDLAPIW